MFEFWREATAASVPGLVCQSGRRRPEKHLYLKFPSMAAGNQQKHLEFTFSIKALSFTRELA